LTFILTYLLTYLLTDFTYLVRQWVVTKYAEHKWKILRPQLFEVLMEWADTGKPALLDMPEITDTTILEDDDEVVAMIKELIEARIRPAVQEDGGDIRYVEFAEDTGIVTVELAGSCVGCPSSSVTLKQGVENMLMHYIPEVTAVQALEKEEDMIDDEGTTNGAAGNQKSYEERLAAAGIPFSE
jgi:Fe-S cluster biogenesis protein NfuA